jgi:hypothetical protein
VAKMNDLLQAASFSLPSNCYYDNHMGRNVYLTVIPDPESTPDNIITRIWRRKAEDLAGMDENAISLLCASHFHELQTRAA